MDCATAPAKRRKLNPRDKALRRERIFERLRAGWSYHAVAREERVTPRRVRQIVSEALARRPIDCESDHAMLQLVRLENALRLAADTVAKGETGAISILVNVLDRLDRYQRGAAPPKAHDGQARERLFAKMNRIVDALAASAAKLTAPPPEGERPPAAKTPEPESKEALPRVSPASP
jgi:hypothetical protein